MQDLGVFAHLLAAWNERDPAKVRGHLDRAVSESVVFADPVNFLTGRDAFESMIREFRERYPLAACRRTSGFDSHNGRFRYTWEIHDGTRVFVKGTDFVRLGDDGLVASVDGFFGDLPPIED
jgi:nuclear transport factor 2 (NTF2) superfamily protein